MMLKLLPVLNLVGIVWYMFSSWGLDSKKLFWTAALYLATVVGVMAHVLPANGWMLLLLVVLLFVLFIGSMLNVWRLWMPMAICTFVFLYANFGPHVAKTDPAEQQLFDEGSDQKTFTPR